MTISLDHIGKRYNYEWIFRHINYTFAAGRRYALLGPNGSGKSTLLQIIAGSLTHSEGRLHYDRDGRSLSPESAFRYLSLAAPYLELVEEFTLRELLDFHRRFKPFVGGLSTGDIAAKVQLAGALDKQIRYFSSGMKQRVKLAQAFFSDVPVLLLDEPCTSLDDAGLALYGRLMEGYTAGRLVIVGSNDPREYDCCGERLRLSDFK